MTGAAAVNIPIATISRCVAAAMNVTEREIISSRRDATTVRARYVVYYLARRLTTLTYQEIGYALGGREHSTALQGFRACQELTLADPEFAADVATVEATLIAIVRRNPALRRNDVDPLAAARRIISNPARHAPSTPYDAVVAMAALLIDLAEIAQGMRELLDVRTGRADAPPVELAEIDAALTASLVSMLDEISVPSRHLQPALKAPETAHVA